jgi:hypothetical protein
MPDRITAALADIRGLLQTQAGGLPPRTSLRGLIGLQKEEEAFVERQHIAEPPPAEVTEALTIADYVNGDFGPLIDCAKTLEVRKWRRGENRFIARNVGSIGAAYVRASNKNLLADPGVDLKELITCFDAECLATAALLQWPASHTRDGDPAIYFSTAEIARWRSQVTSIPLMRFRRTLTALRVHKRLIPATLQIISHTTNTPLSLDEAIARATEQVDRTTPDSL